MGTRIRGFIMGKTKRRRRKSKVVRREVQHRRSIFAVSSVVILLVAVMSVSGLTLRAKEKDYQAQIRELEQQIEDEKARAEEIDELEEYVGTDEYVEEVAKDKLGLVNKNEIIFKAR